MDITDGIKKIFLAGVGAVATTGEAAKNLIDNLVEKGELTVEQGKALNEEMRKNAKEKLNKHVTVNVVHEFKDVFSAIDKMSKEELDELKQRLNAASAAREEAPGQEEACDCGCEETSECGCGCEAPSECECNVESPSECAECGADETTAPEDEKEA